MEIACTWCEEGQGLPAPRLSPWLQKPGTALRPQMMEMLVFWNPGVEGVECPWGFGWLPRQGTLTEVVVGFLSTGVNESPLMTWGEVENTPLRVEGSETPYVDRTPGPAFKVRWGVGSRGGMPCGYLRNPKSLQVRIEPGV